VDPRGGDEADGHRNQPVSDDEPEQHGCAEKRWRIRGL
jgi:hypothetical protein